MISRYRLAFVWAACLSPLGAETQIDASTYTLQNIMVMAISRAPGLEADAARIRQWHALASQTRAWKGLSLEASAGQRKRDEATGPRFEAELAQPLPLLGKEGLRGTLLEAESALWQQKQKTNEAALRQHMIGLAYDYMSGKRQADFARERRKRFELLESYMAGRVFASPQKKTEARIVHNRLALLTAHALEVEASKQTAFEALQTYAGLPADPEPTIDIPWLQGTRRLSKGSGLEKLAFQNPDLLTQQAAVRTSEIEQTLARRDRWPDPTLVAHYDQAKAGETEKNFGLGLGLALPAWNGQRDAIQSATHKKRAEEKLLASHERRLAAEFSQALVAYEAARQKAQLYPLRSIEPLLSQLEEAERAFRKGQVDLLSFLELDNSVADAFTQTVEAQRELVAALGTLWHLKGEADPLSDLATF